VIRPDRRATRDIADLLRRAGREVILPHFRRLDVAAVRMKTGPLDLVTAADEAAERLITDGLHHRFPGCLVVGEEACAADPTLLGRLGDAELAFVLDPIDGTANYVAELPLFGTMVAAVYRGEIVASVIYDPVGDDSALAVRGEGAWIEAPDGATRDLRVAAPGPAAAMTGSVSWRYFPEPMRQRVCANLCRMAAAWDYRCAAHQYRMLAAGHCHFAMFHRLMPWDHAPGWLLHREAGGYALRLDGTEYSAARSDGGMLCAPDAASWDALRETLLGA